MDAGDNDALRNFVLKQLSDPDAFLEEVAFALRHGRGVCRPAGFQGRPHLLNAWLPDDNGWGGHRRVWSFRDITERKRQEES